MILQVTATPGAELQGFEVLELGSRIASCRLSERFFRVEDMEL